MSYEYIKDVAKLVHHLDSDFTELEAINALECMTLSGDETQDAHRALNILYGEL